MALLAMGLTVAAQYPATWAAERIVAATGYRALLADSQGIIWHGSATLALIADNGGADATVLPGRLSWSADTLPLLTSVLWVHLACEYTPEKPVALTVTPGHWDAEVGTIVLLVLLLEDIGAPFNILKLDDRLRAQ